MPKFNALRAAIFSFILAAAGAHGQTFVRLWTFTNGISPNDILPNAGVVVEGNTLYGIQTGGANGAGAGFFELNLGDGEFTNLATLPADSFPETTLTPAAGFFFGVDQYGGGAGDGSVFQIDTNGTGLAVDFSFSGVTNGTGPTAGLVLAGGMLYGTTLYGGPGDGTIFGISTNGSNFVNLYTFASIAMNSEGVETNHDGFDPEGCLVADTNGVLYGTTYDGGLNGGGTVFKLNTNGSGFTVLHTFDYFDGFNPAAALTVTNGVVYGTTQEGGANGNGTIFSVSTTGQNFTLLYSFSSLGSSPFTNSDGAAPRGSLVLVSNLLYGTASEGGASGAGTIFSIATNGANFTTLYQFTGSSDGAEPSGNLAYANNSFYGTTSHGGTGNGTIFELTFQNLSPCPLNIQLVGGNVQLTWTNAALVLQASASLFGPYTDIGLPSPCILPATNTQQFFRLGIP